MIGQPKDRTLLVVKQYLHIFYNNVVPVVGYWIVLEKRNFFENMDYNTILLLHLHGIDSSDSP